jgi:hypothetical protein
MKSSICIEKRTLKIKKELNPSKIAGSCFRDYIAKIH